MGDKKEEFGMLLKRLLKRRGISVANLADMWGCTRSFVYAILAGRSALPEDKLQNLCEYLEKNNASDDEVSEISLLWLGSSASDETHNLIQQNLNAHGTVLQRHYWNLFDQQTPAQREKILSIMLQNIEDNLEEMSKLSKK